MPVAAARIATRSSGADLSAVIIVSAGKCFTKSSGVRHPSRKEYFMSWARNRRADALGAEAAGGFGVFWSWVIELRGREGAIQAMTRAREGYRANAPSALK